MRKDIDYGEMLVRGSNAMQVIKETNNTPIPL